MASSVGALVTAQAPRDQAPANQVAPARSTRAQLICVLRASVLHETSRNSAPR